MHSLQRPPDVGYTSSRCMWMKNLADRYPSFAGRPLAEIALPGSHDAASHGVSPSSPFTPDCSKLARASAVVFGGRLIRTRFSPWLKCQSGDVFTQLQNGIRYLDLRVCHRDNQFWLCHHLLSVPFSEVLEDITRFVSEVGVDEVILLDFQHLYLDGNDLHIKLLKLILSKLGKYILASFENTCRVTLREIWKGSQRVLVFYGNPTVAESHPWLWNRQETIESPWHNTPDIGVLLRSMTKQWKCWKEKGSLCCFTVTQSQRSPSRKLTLVGMLNAGSATSPRTVLDLASGTHPLVCQWLQERDTLAKINREWSG